MSDAPPSSLLRTKGVSLERLDAFRAIYEAEGIARAAPGDPVRQSQLSRQLGELERALACALFERRGRSLVPTPAAAALARVVRDLGEGLAQVARAEARTPSWTLAAGGGAITWLVLPALAAAPAPPRLETLALSSEDVVEHVRDGRADLGVLRAAALTDDLDSARVGVVRYRFFCAHTRGARVPTLREAVRARPLVSISGEPRLADVLASLGTPTLVVETFAQAAAAIRTKRFAGVLPAFAAAELPAPHFDALDSPTLARAAAPLVLAWRSRLADTRAGFTDARDTLLHGMRAVLRGSP